MALIEIFPLVHDEYEVNPDWDFAVDGRIIEGQVVALETVGTDTFVKLCGTADEPIGLAGDTLTDSEPADDTEKHRPFQDGVIINRSGATRHTSNRVADFYDETRSSGKMTVFHGGGTFATDQYDADDDFEVGDKLYSDANGKVSKVNAGSQTVIAVVTAPVGAKPSGVPGTEIDGSLSLGDFLSLVLRV